jgi:Na+-driven multidrug efflux pump
MLLAWLAGPALYHALGGRGPALAAAVTYSNVVFAGSIPFWVVNLLAAALRGRGDVRTPATVTLVGALVILGVSPALIFGVGPLPRLGIAGAGLAVDLFYLGAAIYMMRVMRLGLRPPRVSRPHLRDILRVGLLTAVSTIQPNLTVIVVTGAVGSFGVAALAGYGMASRLDYLLVPVLFGIGTAVLTLVGTHVGAGQLERARRIAWVGGALGFVVAETVGVAVALAPGAWLGVFSHDGAVVAPGVLYLRLCAPFYGLLGLGFVLGFAAQGRGRPLWPFLAGTTRMLVAAGVGWLAVAKLGAGLHGLFAVVAAALVAFALVMVLAVRSGRVFGGPTPPSSGSSPR